LAERLLASLDQETDSDAEKLWRQEAERRLADFESGNVSGVAADHVFEKARSRLR
jgi:putative addiction module component (TIGR02574 family)